MTPTPESWGTTIRAALAVLLFVIIYAVCLFIAGMR